MRKSIRAARFFREEESGFIPDQVRANGAGLYAIPSDESQVRSLALSGLDNVEFTLDELVGRLNLYSVDGHDGIQSISSHIDDFWKIVRDAARGSENYSLNQVCLYVMYVEDGLYSMQKSVLADRHVEHELREREIAKGMNPKKAPAWIAEERSKGELPLPE